jgi:hypothetical protein
VHKVTYFQINQQPPNHTARCRCGWTPKRPLLTQQMVQDEVASHERDIDRVRLHLRHGSGTMRGDRDHALKMSEDPNVSEADRVLWQQLHGELDRRLGKVPTVDDQPELPLFD